jgi:hypothetical protein
MKVGGLPLTQTRKKLAKNRSTGLLMGATRPLRLSMTIEFQIYVKILIRM